MSFNVATHSREADGKFFLLKQFKWLRLQAFGMTHRGRERRGRDGERGWGEGKERERGQAMANLISHNHQRAVAQARQVLVLLAELQPHDLDDAGKRRDGCGCVLYINACWREGYE